MRRRSTIQKMIDVRMEKIKSIKKELIELKKEDLLLSDKNQQFIEKEEEVLICGRPKKYETVLVGRIHWKEDFIDESTGDVFVIDRCQTVRENGEWL